jgi:hypothetical protein
MLKNLFVCLLLMTALSGLALAQPTITVSFQGGVAVITAQSGDLKCIFSRLKHTDSVTAVCYFGPDQTLNTAVNLDYGQSYSGEVDQPPPHVFPNFISWTLTHVGPAQYTWSVNDDGAVQQSGTF